jgi:Doubled CXXCH motif (Paired_CXXCH_1)
MSRPVRVAIWLALAWAAVAPSSRAAPLVRASGTAVQLDTAYGCTVCHADHREALIAGVHAERGIRCADCHGGDTTALSLPAAHRGRFIAARDKVTIVQLCGSCHSDPNRMRQYGLPTGQLAEYRTSRHGQLLLLQHNSDAPACTDCHGTHTIYPPDDARSKVYPTNIPGTCAHCHSDQRFMAPYHLPTHQFAQFRTSVHGVALYQRQNFSAPTCVGCHGAHSALPPAVTEIANVCERCHALVGQAFASGPHGAPARTGKLPGCLGCHSNHGTERVPADSIADVCAKCHGSDTRIREMGLEIQQGVVRATEDLQSAERAVGQLELAGQRTTDYRFRYQSALTYYRQIAQVQHSLDLERLDDLVRHVRSISVALDAAAEANAEQRWEHKLILIPVWFLALSGVVLVWFSLRALKEAGKDREP